MPSWKWQQYRRTIAGSGGIDVVTRGQKGDTWQDLRVRNPEKGSPTAEVTVYGVKRESWESVAKDDPLEVHIGHESLHKPVFVGIITDLSPLQRDDSGGWKYTLEGEDQTRKRLANSYATDSWNDPNPGMVVRDIATKHANIGVGRVTNAGGTIGQTFQINEDQPLAHHLDRLKREAQDIDGKQYQWYCEAGKLYFYPREETRDRALELSGNKRTGALREIEKASSTDKKTDGGPAFDFSASIDPRIQKDGIIMISDAKHPGSYRVAEYEFSSRTESSEHKMSGKLEPTDTKYRLVNGRTPVDTTGSAGGRLTRG